MYVAFFLWIAFLRSDRQTVGREERIRARVEGNGAAKGWEGERLSCAITRHNPSTCLRRGAASRILCMHRDGRREGPLFCVLEMLAHFFGSRMDGLRDSVPYSALYCTMVFLTVLIGV